MSATTRTALVGEKLSSGVCHMISWAINANSRMLGTVWFFSMVCGTPEPYYSLAHFGTLCNPPGKEKSRGTLPMPQPFAISNTRPDSKVKSIIVNILRAKLRNRPKETYRHTAIRLPKEDLIWLNQECAKIGISVSTAIRWLIAQARQDGSLRLPKKPNPPKSY